MTDISSIEVNKLRRTIEAELKKAKDVWLPVWLEQSGFVQKAKDRKWQKKSIESKIKNAYEEAFWKEYGLEQIDEDVWMEFFFEGPISETFALITSFPKALYEHFESIHQSIGHKMEQQRIAVEA
ncbi:MAG: hypothetical protein KAS32_05725 [Candidatus Peribacteraceae bacterium]|nr:hypothetical protein [Candidatus Peribacteraceae bacterium]